jgi:hypothetical protein
VTSPSAIALYIARGELVEPRAKPAHPFASYRLLDQTNYRKSVDQVLALLQVLDCEVDLIVRTKTA